MISGVSFMGGRNTCLPKAEAEKMVKQLTKNREPGIHPEHLVKAEEILAARLISIHNIHFLQNLMKNIREAIKEDRFLEFKNEFYEKYGLNDSDKDF